MILVGLVAIAGAIWLAAQQVVRELRLTREAEARARAMMLLGTFAPAIQSVQTDPRALLTWQPLARIARQMYPTESAALDKAAGATFPFSTEQIQAAHARWTADWLAWERNHDAEYKQKAAEVEHELAASGGSPVIRARLDAVEREKLDRYQRRYQDYVQVAKALQELSSQTV